MKQPTPFINMLRKRRSIRQYKQQSLAKETIDLLQEALLRAPTSRGKNSWNFIFIEDHKLLEKMSRAKTHGSTFLAGAALGVVICADEEISDVWIEDSAIAAITLQYAAHDLGLGSCWAQIRNRPHNDETDAEDFLKELLTIKDNTRILCIIGIGFPNEEKSGLPKSRLPTDKIKSMQEDY
jgi:nitroreductase